MRTVKAAAAMVLLSGAAACSDTDLLGLYRAHSGEGGVRTDSTMYHVTTTDVWRTVTMEVSFRNPMTEEVFIPKCHGAHPPTVEKLGPDGWVTVYSPVVLLCYEPPVRVASGAAYSMSYQVIDARRHDAGPRLDVDEIAGTYRLNWTVLGTKSGDPLPESVRTSNPFQLTD